VPGCDTTLPAGSGRIAASDVATTLLNEVQSICAPLGATPALTRAAALTDRLASG